MMENNITNTIYKIYASKETDFGKKDRHNTITMGVGSQETKEDVK